MRVDFLSQCFFSLSSLFLVFLSITNHFSILLPLHLIIFTHILSSNSIYPQYLIVFFCFTSYIIVTSLQWFVWSWGVRKRRKEQWRWYSLPHSNTMTRYTVVPSLSLANPSLSVISPSWIGSISSSIGNRNVWDRTWSLSRIIERCYWWGTIEEK